MKTKLLFAIALAMSFTLSYGQKVTNVNYTGCLAYTGYNQYTASNNETIETAFGGWVSTIAAPTVNLANITDMTFTFESDATYYGVMETSPSPAGPIPTDYSGAAQNPIGSNVPLIYSQFYVKSTSLPKVPARWRKTSVHVNPLTISSLPIVVANSASLQSGYSFCGEMANGGTSVQLHTNGQAVYLAFNSAAHVFKFQYENVGKATAQPGAILAVEQSADLATWTTIENIDISNQITSSQGSGKVDVSYSITDVTTRYIRIRIAGLSNSRDNRKENIRNIAVQTKPIITWNQDLTTLKMGDDAVTLNATSTVSSASTPAGSDIVYTASDANVISIMGNSMSIVGVGNATVTASQEGNSSYAAATPVVMNVVVTDSTTSIQGLKSNLSNIRIIKNGIVADYQGNLEIISLTGTTLKKLNVTKGQIVNLSLGTYIARTVVDGVISTSKVIVL